MSEQNTFIIDVDVKPLKAQLKDATRDLQAARQKFGEFSEEAVNAAQKVAAIKDAIEGAKESSDLFDPGKRFQALTSAASTAAAGVSAVQGAMALFGSESEDVAKTLQKVQGAMALSQGLSQLKDIGKVGEQLKISFKALTTGVNGFKKALISTGIGALVVAVGLLVAYWDDIKGLVGGVSSEQQKLNEESEANLQAQEDKLSAIDGQSAQLKMQGKSEKDILKMKIAQSDEAIKAAEINLQNAKNTRDAQVAAARRNKDILMGILNFINAPTMAILKTIDAIGTAFGQTWNLAGKQQAMLSSMANYVFDPKDTEKKGNETVAKAMQGLNRLKESKAQSQLALQAIDAKGREKGNKDSDAHQKKVDEANAILHEAAKKLKTQQEQELLTITDAYKEKKKKLDEAGIKDNGDLAKAEKKELEEVENKYKKEELEKQEAFEKELNRIKLETRLAGIKDEYEKSKAELEANYLKELEDIDKNEKYTAEQKTALKIALKQKEDADLAALKFTADQKQAAEDIAELDRQISKASADFNLERNLLDQKDILLKQSFDNKLISEKEYTDGVNANADARIEIDKKETAAKIENAQKISALLGGLSDVMGKETAAGKAFAVAQATIDTYLAAQKAYQSMVGIPVVGPALGAVAAGVAVAGGIKNVKSILAVKTPAGGGASGSAPTAQAAPAVTPQLPTIGSSPITALQSSTKQAPIKAYVVESDVTSSQKRVSDIERRAGF
jgi:hypothetical protein